MSSLTRCNRCSLDDMQRRAIAAGVSVILTLEPDGWTSARYSDRTEPSSWFLELTESCVC
jgi:hypothetical protein